MAERWPRLSRTLSGAPNLDACMRCGSDLGVEKWQEHDDRDQREPVVILLCRTCSDEIVEPHPRLYRKLHDWEPFPGAMALCRGCPHQVGLSCRHPDLKANGGAGLAITYPRPAVALVDGVRNGRRTGWRETLWQGPPTACAGREAQP